MLALHVIVLQALLHHKFQQEQSLPEQETPIQLLLNKLAPPKPKPVPQAPDQARHSASAKPAVPAKPAAAAPAPSTNAPQEPVQPSPPQAAPDSKPLDYDKIMSEVRSDTRKEDSKPGAQISAGPPLPTLRSKMEQILSNATARPKAWEAARVEDISTGAQRDVDIHIYKIITFAGTFCVTYHASDPPVKSLCPIYF